MLEHTFCHLPSCGPKTEAKLWDNNVRHWDDVFESDIDCITPAKLERYRQVLEESRARFQERDAAYFNQVLPSNQLWRGFADFQDSVAYIDIETTGTMDDWDHITTIALYDGKQVKTYVHGQNLDEFEADIAAYKAIVTFNGKSFDVPIIERQFRMRMDQLHIDLRFVLKSLGYSGGLKAIEKQLGLYRAGLEGVDGMFAVVLWHDYVNRDYEPSLQTLLAYNVEDVINLETLAVYAFNQKLKSTPFADGRTLPDPISLPNPYTPDLELVDQLKRVLGVAAV